MLSECKADPKHASHTRPPAWTWCVLVHSCNIAVHPLLWSDSSCPATCCHGEVAHHECGLETAPLPLQLMAAAAGTTYGGAWEQQPLWRLQSAPVTLHLTSADSVRSSTGCVYMYAALQDKSLHKYKLVVPPTMPAAQAKVRLILLQYCSLTYAVDLSCMLLLACFCQSMQTSETLMPGK